MAAQPVLLGELRAAIECGGVEPFFEPIVQLRTGRLWGFEALARWRHPRLGMVPPDTFVPMAEKADLIGRLAETILAKAFLLIPELPPDLTLSVNISPIQFRDRSLPEQIRVAADRARFPLNQLNIELTESALLGNLELALEIAEDLKSMGVRLALDDFGTGYSSLRHLQALPFDAIKIDRSFVESITYRRQSRKIAAAVVGLGHSLGLQTVAEGIEDKMHADLMFYLGCELGQGWLYGQAVPATEVPAIVAKKVLSPPQRAVMLATDMATHLELAPTQRLAQLQAIYEGAPVALCFLDKELRYISQNRRLSEMSRAAIAPRLGHTVEEASPFVFEQLGAEFQRALAGEAIAGIEVRTEKPESPGEFNTLLVSLQPARDEAHEIVGISVAAVDITERKQTEEALRESEEHYRNTLELSPHVPWTADPDGRILSAGPRWQELTGLTAEETLDEGWRNGVHPDDLARTEEAWAHSLRTGEPIDVEFRIGRGDRVWRWMRSRAAPRRNAEGMVTRWYGMVEDIDDRKRLEEALRMAEARIEELLRLREG